MRSAKSRHKVVKTKLYTLNMAKRLKKLWKFIDENLEVDYGYLAKSHMNDKDDSRVDEYIQEIKNDFKEMRKKGCIKEEFMQENIDILKKLDNI